MAGQFASVSPDALWRGSDFATKDQFAVDLSFADLAPEMVSLRALVRAGREPHTVSQSELPLNPWAGQLAALREQVLHGRGFAVLRGIPVGSAHHEETELLFWAIGLHLGRAVSQSVMGDRLGHIIDVTDKDPHARAYRNRSELTPHTDPGDILSFLCLHAAKSGGISQFSSSHLVHEELRATRPDLLARLYRGYRYHRFGEQADGDDPVTPHRVPVFSECEGQLSARYVRQYIEIAADEHPDIVLDDLDCEALDQFEAIAIANQIEFTLEPGEAIVANNYTVLHARTGFEDFPEAERKRHLLRLWLSAEPKRPVVDETYIYGTTEPGIPPQPGRTPSYAHGVSTT